MNCRHSAIDWQKGFSSSAFAHSVPSSATCIMRAEKMLHKHTHMQRRLAGESQEVGLPDTVAREGLSCWAARQPWAPFQTVRTQ